MNNLLPWVLVFGPILLVEALMARHEVLVYGAGRRAPVTTLPKDVPYARGASLEDPPGGYLVYLDGIGKRRVRDSREGGRLVEALIAKAPELRVLGQIQPYSPLAVPIADRPVWAKLRRRFGPLLIMHNFVQFFVATDRRYRPVYNRALGFQIATQLQLAGYRPGSGVPVVLFAFSGGSQAATGVVEALDTQLRCPLLLITLGGVHSGGNDISRAEHLYQLSSSSDRIERFFFWFFPKRWRLVRFSTWNRTEHKVTMLRLDHATHTGPQSYMSPVAEVPDGRTHLDHTTDIVVGLVRTHFGSRLYPGNT
ncbi:hypothetical protein [Streptomyces cadmiisoli]|uniref:hypothetical protein n=1 Tax=Streptomyces cadmiisoli TaxID=2184053 RepID=UPI00364A0800